ncbi:MAG: Exonuclease-like protein [Thermococcus sibiricus]|uniref:Exonuclease-like protein n=2 Tax=Thermococcus sibiricus TaxID=172049 RepID=C6A1W5_THESM|nr:exonuclease-like protein [Thermococcus sibiricus MM 739]KUK16629.1 MAG: Exonuclease-like protein [Thermococcus sibiricus]
MLIEWNDYFVKELKRRFMEKYGEKPLEEAFPVRDTKKCCLIEERERIKLELPDVEKVKWNLLSSLSLLPGVGPRTEMKLKERGYSTLKDLMKHPRFENEASRILRLLEERRIHEIVEYIGRRFKMSHPLILHCAAFHDLEKFLVVDIETLGLFNCPIILIGTGEFRGNEFIVKQYFARNLREEESIIRMFLDAVREKEALITFNGRRFDVPFIQERLQHYGIEEKLELPNYDIYLFSRGLVVGVPDHRLQTLERYLLGIEREDDVPSALIPDFYYYYLKTGKAALAIPIIKHNALDIITTARLFDMLLKTIRD